MTNHTCRSTGHHRVEPNYSLLYRYVKEEARNRVICVAEDRIEVPVCDTLDLVFIMIRQSTADSAA